MFNKQTLARDIALLTAGTLLASASAMADNWAIEEIVVTAQKRAESAQDVPLAISAFSEEMVANIGADEVGDIIAMIPGLNGTTPSGAINFFAIRGIASTDFTIGGEPSVGVYLNDAYIGRNAHATSAFYDVSRIEVVKGPQGTLFGRNAAAGAISIVTNTPQDENTAHIGAAIGNEGQREFDVVGNLAVSDTFAIRGAYHGTRVDGVIEDIVADEDGSIDKDAFRLSVRWNISNELEALLTLDHSEAETRVLNGAYNPGLQLANDTVTSGAGDDYPDKIARTGLDQEHVRNNGANLRLTWDLSDDLTLTSITDYRSFNFDFIQDVDGSQADTFLGNALLDPTFLDPTDPNFLVGTPALAISIQYEQPQVTQESYSQEFRLNGSTDNLEWFVGTSYFKERVGEDQKISALDVSGTSFGGDLDDITHADGQTESLGVYGDVTWAATDKLSLTAGLRWSQDEKEWCSFGANTSNLLGVIDTNGQDICGDETWNEVTPRFVADYALTEDVMAYISFSKGYKGGGFNTPTRSTDNTNDFILDALGVPTGGTLATATPNVAAGEAVFFTGEAVSSFDPETVKAYELGMKGSFLDGQLQLNFATFFNDYQDLQVQSATTAGIITENAAEAETQGWEVDFIYAMTDNLVLMGNYTYLDADFQDGFFAGADISGNNLPFAPENAYSVSVAYELAVGAGSLSMFTAYNWMDEYNNQADNASGLVQEDYGLWNGKVTFRPGDESWDAFVSIDNIENKGYTTWKQDVGLGLGTNYYRGMPRLWKVGFNAYF